MAAKTEPKKETKQDDGVVQLESHGRVYFAWRDDGQRPVIDAAEFALNQHTILDAPLPPDHVTTERP